MASSSQTQLSAAIALNQLLSEHPELPPLFWSMNPDGWCSGSMHKDDVDAHAVMARYAEVLGGQPDEWRRPSKGDETGSEHFATIMHVTWRDVRLYLSMSCDAAMVAETAQVPA